MGKRCARAIAIWIAVTATAYAGSADLSWSPPTQNEDGTFIADTCQQDPGTCLAGFNIYVGCQQSGQYEEPPVRDIPASVTSITVPALPDGQTCYFVGTAFNADGIESRYSAETSVTLDSTVELPGQVANLDVTWQETPEQPMAITYRGADNSGDINNGNESISITIPADADFALMQIIAWDNGTTQTVASATLDGENFTEIASLDWPGAGAAPGYWYGWVKDFSTGASKTLTVTLESSEGIFVGGKCFITFWSGVDLTTPIRSHDADVAGNGTLVDATVGSTQSGDVVVALGHGYLTGTLDITADGSPTITDVYDSTIHASARTTLSYFSRTQATHVVDNDSDDYPGIIAVTLAQASAGGSIAANLSIAGTVAAAIDATGQLDATPSIVANVTAGMSAEGALSATPSVIAGLAGDVSGSGALNASPNVVISVAASLLGQGNLSASLSTVASVAASLLAQGKLEAAAQIIASVSATVSAADASDLSTDLSIALTTAAQLAAQGSLNAALDVVLSAAASVSASGALQASSAIIASLAAEVVGVADNDLTATLPIVASVQSSVTALGSLTVPLNIELLVGAQMSAPGRIAANLLTALMVAAEVIDGNLVVSFGDVSAANSYLLTRDTNSYTIEPDVESYIIDKDIESKVTT